MKNILILSLALILFACTNPVKVDREKVTNDVLTEMKRNETAWNKGDLTDYMQTYMKSDSIRFAGNNSYRFGWDNVLSTYTRGYPDKETMGQLTFSELDVKAITNSDALVFGRFTVVTTADTSTGLFTLLMQKQDNSWRIVHDHSSSNR